MFIFTYELITMAASNSLLVFGFCNLIIVFLLLGSLSSGSQVAEDKTISLPGEVNSIRSSSEGANASLSVNIEVVSDHEESQEEEEEEEDDDDDDELRRRAEEFIEKINRCWREEKLRAYSLEHQ